MKNYDDIHHEEAIISADEREELSRLRQRNVALINWLEDVEAAEKTPIRIEGKVYAFTQTYALRQAIDLPKA